MSTSSAVKSIYNSGSEHYHFNKAIDEYGEKAVINEMAEDIRSKEGISYPDAFVKAGVEFNAIKKIEAGQFNFKEMRDRLNNSQVQIGSALEA